MKTQTKMKKVASLAIMLASLAGTAFADQTPQDAQSQIGAQLGITHDSITQLLNKMDQQSQTNDGMVHADYKVKAVQERAKVQAALDKFESYLRNSLFPELRSDLVNYNNIYSSNQYTDEQKKSLLASMHQQLDALFANASIRYSEAVYAVMAALGPSFRDFINLPQTCQDGYQCNSIEYFSGNGGVSFYNNRILPFLLDGCLSRSCISMSASDQIILLNLSDGSFGKTISFQTLDGNSFTLDAYVSTHISYKTSDFINTYVTELSRTDLFSSLVQQLPFDIDDAQLADQSQPTRFVAERKAALDDLLNKLGIASVTSSEIDSAVTSICGIGAQVPNACKIGLGCPTSDDFGKMSDAVSKNSTLSGANRKDLKNYIKGKKNAVVGAAQPCSK